MEIIRLQNTIGQPDANQEPEKIQNAELRDIHTADGEVPAQASTEAIKKDVYLFILQIVHAALITTIRLTAIIRIPNMEVIHRIAHQRQ